MICGLMIALSLMFANCVPVFANYRKYIQDIEDILMAEYRKPKPNEQLIEEGMILLNRLRMEQESIMSNIGIGYEQSVNYTSRIEGLDQLEQEAIVNTKSEEEVKNVKDQIQKLRNYKPDHDIGRAGINKVLDFLWAAGSILLGAAIRYALP
jgi:hypothetical protein